MGWSLHCQPSLFTANHAGWQMQGQSAGFPRCRLCMLACCSAPRSFAGMSRVCCGQTCKQVSARPPHRFSPAEGEPRVGCCQMAGLGLQAMGCTSLHESILSPRVGAA